MKFILFTSLCLYSYLVLTAGSGEYLYFWSLEELFFGITVSVLLGAAWSRIIPRPVPVSFINPFLWLSVAFYLLVPFFFSLLIANIEVLYRIITGKINPAIVKVETDLKSETGAYILSNSITLSPGTLTIELEPGTNSLYIHCLDWKKKKGEKAEPADVAPNLYYWIKKIFDGREG